MNAIDKKFIHFHQTNPHIYTEILDYANKLWVAGIRRFGMKAIFERIRWDHAIKTSGAPFKISNDYTSRYARLMERDYPRTVGFFKTKQLDPSSIFAIEYTKNPEKHLWP